MTTRPLMWTLASSLRMASTAALSADFPAPPPPWVTRAPSSPSTRSTPPIVSCPWMLFCIAPSPSRYLSLASQRLDTYHLRLLGHLSILVDGLERGADGLFGGLMGNEDDGRGRAVLGLRVDAGLRAP